MSNEQFPTQFSKTLFALIDERGWSQSLFSSKVGISESCISRIISGKPRIPNEELFLKILEQFPKKIDKKVLTAARCKDSAIGPAKEYVRVSVV